MHVAHAGLRDEDIGAGVIDIGGQPGLGPADHSVERHDQHECQRDPAHGDRQPNLVLKQIA